VTQGPDRAAGPDGRRWLVTGAGGMLGHDLVRALAGREVTALTRADLDVTDPGAVAAAVEGHDVVVNAAAWTRVDDAEAHEPEAFTVNAVGAATVATACAAAASRPWLVQISTDYVFAGDATTPYAEEAPVGPRSAYGRTKLAGEWAVRSALPDRSWVLRTAWLYGADGPSFVQTMRRLEAGGGTVDVVDDQVGQPTWTADLAERVVALVDRAGPAGVYHATASGRTSWFGLARLVFELAGADPERVQPTTSAAFVRPAPRPAWSVLGHGAWAQAGLDPMRPWDEALRAAWGTLPEPGS
jgi:dTDP-4-dehydrorhamnose reductase